MFFFYVRYVKENYPKYRTIECAKNTSPGSSGRKKHHITYIT